MQKKVNLSRYSIAYDKGSMRPNQFWTEIGNLQDRQGSLTPHFRQVYYNSNQDRPRAPRNTDLDKGGEAKHNKELKEEQS